MNEAPADGQAAAGGNASPGAALLAERRRQNLSLGDVSRQLKLSVRQVEALERDDFSGFQGPVFIHGFIRNYAKLLALDPVALIRSADALLKPAMSQLPSDAPSPEVTPAAARPGSKWPMGAIVVVIVAGLGLMAVYPRGATKPKPQPEPAATVAAAPQEKRTAAPKAIDKPPADKSAPDKAAPDRPAAEKRSSPPPIPDASTPSAQSGGQAASSHASPGVASAIGNAEAGEGGPRMTLRMIFEQDSWVEVKDRNGNTVFGQLNAAGTRRSASGEPPLSVVVGNAAGVRLFLGEKSIDLAPYTRVDVARLTVE